MGTHLLVLGSHWVIKCSQFITYRYLSWVSQYLNIPMLHCFSLLAAKVQSQPALHIMLHITIHSTQSFFLSMLHITVILLPLCFQKCPNVTTNNATPLRMQMDLPRDSASDTTSKDLCNIPPPKP